MDELKRILNNLISVTDNIYRLELYKNFLNDISDMAFTTEKDMINKMYVNFSGLFAHSELDKKEYGILKQLLQHLEKVHWFSVEAIENSEKSKDYFPYFQTDEHTRKNFGGLTTHFVWDGNVPLHEWTETAESEENVITWLFEQDTFVPAAKLVANGECFSIVSDYLGTPLQAYDKQGNRVWEQELDIYGRQRKRPSAFIPFKYQGQYEDAETGLYYNRFRYYDPNAGSYISQDPIIGLAGKNPTLYAFAKNVNTEVDVLGLDCSKKPKIFKKFSKEELEK